MYVVPKGSKLVLVQSICTGEGSLYLQDDQGHRSFLQTVPPRQLPQVAKLYGKKADEVVVEY